MKPLPAPLGMHRIPYQCIAPERGPIDGAGASSRLEPVRTRWWTGEPTRSHLQFLSISQYLERGKQNPVLERIILINLMWRNNMCRAETVIKAPCGEFPNSIYSSHLGNTHGGSRPAYRSCLGNWKPLLLVPLDRERPGMPIILWSESPNIAPDLSGRKDHSRSQPMISECAGWCRKGDGAVAQGTGLSPRGIWRASAAVPPHKNIEVEIQ